MWAVLYAGRARRVSRGPEGLTAARPARGTRPNGFNGPINGPVTLPKHVPETAAAVRGRHTRQAVVGLALVILAVAAGYVLAV